MKLIDALLQGMADYGVERLFGIPGDFVLPHFRAALASGRLPVHALSHEPSVGARFVATIASRQQHP